ncbi:hypothetical protein FOLKNPGA_03243 [Legionella sp. PC1000]|uniref:ankyrin repeat domain-containing protein n=1 Tax=Legionella sp. PC1000 TaxID=2746060 RepID=UPI0015FE4F84|nr:ankyrin repeat domain-containing protein [Legionella sp. PC1000]QLZ70429.1 hypothetical protein FOLKNPGA_03243 [Legionella sp. PC1000]
MQEKEEAPPLLSKHGQLIDLMKALGYTSSEGGICNGYAYMAMQAIFADEFDVFEQRVNRLLDIPLDDFKKAATIQFNAQQGKETTENLLKKILEDELQANNLLVDTHAFLDGIELTQQRHLYPHLFNDTESLEQDSFVKLITPRKIENQGEIISVPITLSGAYRYEDMASDYFGLLREKINAMIPKPTTPICLTLAGYGIQHAVAVSFDPRSDKWTFIDANKIPAQKFTENDELARAVIKGCSANDIAAIYTHVSVLSENEQLNQELINWAQEVKSRSQKDMAKKANWADSQGGTWLTAAAAGNDFEVITPLVAHGADINKPRADKVTPLILAILNRKVQAIEELIKNNVDLNMPYDRVNTPLRAAIAMKDLHIIEMLLKNGADPNSRPVGPKGVGAIIDSAMEDAISLNDYNIVKLILEYGGKASQRPSGKNKAMAAAIEKGFIESLKALFDHGVDPKGFEEDFSLLLLAVKSNQLGVARLLLEYGDDPEIEDIHESKSARQFAEENNLQEFLELFNNPPPRKEITDKKAAQKEAPSSDNDHAINDFIDDLKKYCQTRRAEWNLPKWMHVNEKSAQYKTNLITLKFGFSVEDKIKAAEKLIAALENKKSRERLTDFDIAALLNSRLYSTVVKKHERLFEQVEEVKAYKNKAEQLANTPQNPAA